MTLATWRSLWLAAFGLSLAACGADGRYVVLGTPHAASASGTIEVDALDGGSTQVALHLEFLPAPGRVAEGSSVFVVWFVPDKGAAVRGGVLRYNQDDRIGDLSATSPFNHFTLKLTAEHDPNARSPSENLIVAQAIQVP